MKEKYSILCITFFIFFFTGFYEDIFAQKITGSEGLLNQLTEPKDYVSKRVSSYDTTGGNNDRFRINKGETKVIAEIKGPGMITHFWNTIMPEPFCSAKAVLRVYWDGEKNPSIEAPIGDFYCVGFGVDKNFTSLPFAVSSEGRARNSFWQMPFKKSAKFTITNEGEIDIVSFYYYIDYRVLKSLPENPLYFHAQYNQQMPCTTENNYLITEVNGSGHYVGVSLNVLQNEPGWWGEGDDMIYVDGEKKPSLQGTGSEDYFCDAWGLNEYYTPFYGCIISETDYDNGSKYSVYRFHIPDPVPFKNNIKVTIEHGTNNNRSDNFSSVAYWYQTEPHTPYPKLPSLNERIPYALNLPNYQSRKWAKTSLPDKNLVKYSDSASGASITAKAISMKKTRFYNVNGIKYNEFVISQINANDEITLKINNVNRDIYNLVLITKASKSSGIFEILKDNKIIGKVNGFDEKEIFRIDTLKEAVFNEGHNTITLRLAGKEKESTGNNINLVYFYLVPKREFVPAWNIAGPFECPKLEDIEKVLPPEEKIDLTQKFITPEGKTIGWEKLKISNGGYLDFLTHYGEIVHKVAYALSYIYSPDACKTKILFGSDDGSRIWVNDQLIHENPIYQWSNPDVETININLSQGWNKVLVKITQSYGWWGFHFRLLDADRKFKYALEN